MRNTVGTRNPAWKQDELILALDLYFKHYPKLPPSASHPDIIELSELLNKLPIFPPDERRERFRNPSGVYMKLANFQWVDPRMSGGLKAVAQRDREVWAEFGEDRTRLHEVATAIRQSIDEATTTQNSSLDDSEEEAKEGAILLRLHKSRERNRAIVKAKKDRVFKETGRLECETCGFDYRKSYGGLGAGFIECHHTIPVSALASGKATKIKDLVLLCANCHRMIHRSSPIKTVDELRTIITLTKSQ